MSLKEQDIYKAFNPYCNSGVNVRVASAVISVPKAIIERIRREAERQGVNLEEYVIELLSRDLDPEDKAREYIEASLELLSQARGEAAKGNVRQAAEKTWGAVALAVKAYAYRKEGRSLRSHRDLWEYKDKVADELGEWVGRAFREASGLHTCFYEGWCTERDIREVIVEVEKLIRKIEEAIG